MGDELLMDGNNTRRIIFIGSSDEVTGREDT